MALSERLQYILDFNTAGAVKSLQKVGDTADKELGKAEAKLDKLGANFTKFGAGAVAFAGIAGAGLVKLASGAAEAEANTAALRQVVDEVAATQIEEWAKGSAVAVGLASKEAIAATTGFAGLGKIIGLSGPELTGFSTGLVEMAANMAAFKDVSPQQALQDLQSLFAGSTEVGRKYNIFLDDATLKSAYFRETGEQVSGTLTAQQRIIATNSELYRQGADMMGQWGRESGGLAGQQAQLRANLINLGDSIGKGVLPMLTGLVGAANKGVEAFSKLDPAVQSSIGRLAALGVAGVGTLGTLSLIAGQLIKMRDRFSDLNEETGERSLNNFGKAAKGVGVALGVAAVAMTAYTANAQSNAKALEHLGEVFTDIGRLADEQLGGALKNAMALASLGGQDLDATLADLARTNIEAARRIYETGASLELGVTAHAKLGVAIAREEAALAQETKTREDFGDEVEENTEQVDAEAEAKKRAEQVTRQVTRATELETAAIENAVDAQLGYIEATERRMEANRRATDAVYAVRDAEDSFAESIWNAVAAQNDQELSAGEQQAAIDQVRQSAVNLADEQVRLAEETAEASGKQLTAKDRADLFRQGLIDMAAQLNGPQRQALLDYIALLDAIPSEKNTNIKTTVTGRGGAGASGGKVALKTGGPVPGPRDAPVPITAHGGEFVLSADVVDAVKRGGKTLGLGGGSQVAASSPSVVSPGAIREAARRMLREEIERYFAEAH